MDINMDTLLRQRPEQVYLDAYLYHTGKTPIKLIPAAPKEKVPIQQTLLF